MARRPLTPDEAVLWRRVAHTVRRLPGRAAVETPVTAKPAAPKRKAGSAAPVVAPLTRPLARRAGTPPSIANTLDGSWDRKLSSGAVTPDRAIDLHGCSAEQAHARLDHALARAVTDHVRVLLVVTGKPPPRGQSRADLPMRGIIRASIGDWIAASRYATRIAAVRTAHPRHGGQGALYIILRRAI